MTPPTTRSLVRGISLSFSNSILRLPHNGFKRVRFLESQSCVLVSVLSLSRVWVGHCWRLRVGEEGSGGVERRLCGWLVLERAWRRRFPVFSPCPHFLVFFRDTPFLLISRSSSPWPGISIKRSPTLPLSLTLSLSDSVGSRPCFQVFSKPW